MLVSRLPQRDIVLIGAGHTNAHVLRMWRMAPLPDTRLTCVSPYPVAAYSGMLPGTLAGLYEPDDMQIDLVRLCAAAGVRLIVAPFAGLDLSRREVLLADRAPIRFDLASLGVGSRPRMPDALEAATPGVLSIKPMQTFLERLDARLLAAAAAPPRELLRVTIVGAGAGGVELAFCLPPRVRKLCGERPLELTVVDRHTDILPGLPRSTARLVQAELTHRGVTLLLGQEVQQYRGGLLALSDGRCLPADLVLCATSAAAPPELARCGLALDEHGFVQTRDTLEAVGAQGVFAVGDCGTIVDHPAPKAGVYAVRQGPVLWENLRRKLSGGRLQSYRPQSGFLSLLATGDGRAILSYKGRTALGRCCWRLKDHIDRKFMRMYQDYTPAAMAGLAAAVESEPGPAAQMRCTGCGGKVAGGVLSAVLPRLPQPNAPHVLLGLGKPDDAAIIAPPGDRPVALTADFFTAFCDDPYLVGRVTAIHAATDLAAIGARSQTALALATIPQGPPAQQEELLFQLLSGATQELNRMGCTLVGGHTIEGPQTTLGFTLLGSLAAPQPLAKSGLRPGDALVLTKPLGVGVLLAALAQARCRAEWYTAMIENMLADDGRLVELFQTLDIQGVTDVTGFGLAGHLLEMLRASDTAAEIRLADVPLLPGAEQLLAQGLESTLAPANRQVQPELDAAPSLARQPRFAALFDPQTSGGLLLGVPARQVNDCLAELARCGAVAACVIGHVAARDARSPRLRVG